MHPLQCAFDHLVHSIFILITYVLFFFVLSLILKLIISITDYYYQLIVVRVLMKHMILLV